MSMKCRLDWLFPAQRLVEHTGGCVWGALSMLAFFLCYLSGNQAWSSFASFMMFFQCSQLIMGWNYQKMKPLLLQAVGVEACVYAKGSWLICSLILSPIRNITQVPIVEAKYPAPISRRRRGGSCFTAAEGSILSWMEPSHKWHGRGVWLRRDAWSMVARKMEKNKKKREGRERSGGMERQRQRYTLPFHIASEQTLLTKPHLLTAQTAVYPSAPWGIQCPMTQAPLTRPCLTSWDWSGGHFRCSYDVGSSK